MTFKRITAESIEIVCINCGHLSVYALADLQAGANRVQFPICSGCRKARLQVNVEVGASGKKGQAATHQSWVKALHQKLVAADRFEDGVTAENVQDGAHTDAATWPTEAATVEFDLSPQSAKLYKTWQEQHS